MRLLAITSLVVGSASGVSGDLIFAAGKHQISAGYRYPGFTDVADASRYVTAPVKADEVVKTVMATGALIPSLNVEVGLVLSGQILKLCVDFNDKVVKGQVLAELDDVHIALAANASQAALEGARADIKACRSPP